MLRRVFWMAVGASGSMWLSRRLRRRVGRYQPDQVLGRASGAARSLGTELKATVDEARAAMREREAALRAQFEARR